MDSEKTYRKNLLSRARALENLNDVGIPLADSLAERLGAHVIILVVGPVGTEGGEVALRSYVLFFAWLRETRLMYAPASSRTLQGG